MISSRFLGGVRVKNHFQRSRIHVESDSHQVLILSPGCTDLGCLSHGSLAFLHGAGLAAAPGRGPDDVPGARAERARRPRGGRALGALDGTKEPR